MAQPSQGAPVVNEQELQSILQDTLCVYNETRKRAEDSLKQAQRAPGFPLVVLRVVATDGSAVDETVRHAAAVHFKNLVKKGWAAADEEESDGIVFQPSERDMIKSHLVELMCTVPPNIQAQCSESISLIAAADFPAKWQNLLSELVGKFTSPDPTVVKGVLLTLDSILTRFRYVQRSDALYSDLAYVLKHLQEPFLKLFQFMSNEVQTTHANDIRQLLPRMESLRIMCSIWYSLNYQDLPEYFEDHIGEWMGEFAKYLQYDSAILRDDMEETEPGPVDRLQSAIVENLDLYAAKDEEPFLPFLPQFTTLVWNRLLGVTALPKHDELATASIHFLSSLVSKAMHRALFQEESTLRQIVAKIVIPNITIREVDQERFEDDPQEFILEDTEGSDRESRRKRAQQLLRAMCRQFEPETTKICSEHVGVMLAEYAADPNNKWAPKDAAIHLMLGISVRAESDKHGVSAINEQVNVMDFFKANILTELQETNMAVRPMVKATAIKFVTTFRNQFTDEHITALMPLLINHLSSPMVVVHTYAAIAIERILSRTSGVATSPSNENAYLKPFLHPLFTGLFGIVENEDFNENEYVMKCVMRCLGAAQGDIVPVTKVVLEKLTAAVGRAAKNPRNPHYNHYMFESIAALVKTVCLVDATHTSSFEDFLFPPFQTILQMDVVEFIPYVFQVLAQLLEYRPKGGGLGQAYGSLFAPLLTPALWERKGNVPALTRLLQAYLEKGASDVVAQGHLSPLLGVFQKLVSSRANEASAFDLLGSIVQNVPLESLHPNLAALFQILLTRLMASRTAVRYVRLVTDFFALFTGLFGPQLYFEQLNAMQPGLGMMILEQVWTPRISTDPPRRLDAKVQVIGLTKFLCEAPELLADANGQRIWALILEAVVTIIVSPDSHLGKVPAENKSSLEDLAEDGGAEIGFDATYSRLRFAVKAPFDAFVGVPDPSLNFVQALHSFGSSHPGRLPSLIQQSLQSDPKLAVGLESLFQKAGLSLV